MRALVLLVAMSVCAPWTIAQDKTGEPRRGGPTSQPAKATAETATSPLDFTMQSIDGQDVPLSKYKGQVVLIVNVASKCGFTPQYKPLQEAYEKYKDRGLRILAFPANNFRQQEPGTNKEIKEFCDKNYGVAFDLFSKVSVKGDDMCELYKFLTSKAKDAGFDGEIPWNFTKFLVGRDGKVIGRFDPKVKPDDPEVVKAIEQALEQKAPEGAKKPEKP